MKNNSVYVKRAFLSVLLCILLIPGMLPSVSVQSQALPGVVSTNGDFTVDCVAVSQWEHGYTAAVTITNTGETAIQNWRLAFLSADQIISVWNAAFTSENGCYQIKNAGWNADIQPGGSVSFGFTASCGETADIPHTFWMLGKEETLPGEACRVTFRITSLWEKGYTGELCLENLTDRPLEGWQLSFDLPDEIDSLWEAELSAHEDGRYLLKHKDYNSAIPARGSVTMGFTVHGTDFCASPEHFEVRRMITNEIPKDAYDEEIGIAYIKETEPEDVRLAEDGIKYTRNQLNLVGTEACDFETMSGLGEAYSFRIVGYIELTNDYQIEFISDQTYEQLLKLKEELARKEWIEEANLNTAAQVYTEEDFAPNDSKWVGHWRNADLTFSNWGMKAIHAPKAWSYRNNMGRVRIGLLDTMFDTGHEDLNFRKVWNNPSNTAVRSEDDSNHTHGTHVAGTMAAAFHNKKGVAGLCVNHDLYGYALYGDKMNYYCSIMKYKHAFALMIGNNVRVINCSMGYNGELVFAASQGNRKAVGFLNENAAILGSFLDKLLSKGYDFVITTAAGNSNAGYFVPDTDADWGWKGSKEGMPGAVRSGEGACYMDAKYNNALSCISNTKVRERILVTGNYQYNEEFGIYTQVSGSEVGNRVDVIAPGTNILSTVPGNRYAIKSGTSMSVPHTAGVAALIYAVNPGLSGKDVSEIIRTTGKFSLSYEFGNPTSRYRYLFLYKSIDAGEAVKEALRREGGSTPPVNEPLGIVIGTVMDAKDKGAISNVQVTAYKYDSNEGSAGMGAAANYQGVVGTNKNGEFDFELDPGMYQLKFYKEGYFPLVLSDVKAEPEEVNYLERITLLKNDKPGVTAITGKVRDALSGNPLSGVTVRLRKGWNTKTGEALGYDVTDPSGTYVVNHVEQGYYTAEFSKGGYITGYLNAVSGAADISQDAVITPKLPDNEYRIVLTWGSTPADLDSHLTGPAGDGGRFHVYYGFQTFYEGKTVVAKLDLDDTNAYGPETVTVKDNRKGVYRYSVHDYTNTGRTGSTALSLSGAAVKVYRGNFLVKTYQAPVNKGGTLWTVFEMEDGNIRPVNEMSFASSASGIR